MTFDESLDHVETVVRLVSASLLGRDALAVEKASTQLRDVMQALSGLAPQLHLAQASPQSRQRLQRLGEQLITQREHLARVSAQVQRQAAALVPQQASWSPYGHAARAGAQASVSRMYHAAG